ncbi:hypothetical protein [Brevundimonas sp. Root1423]|uniref:hypothetical protein n=1 Tax=Brevundimonas sp. Root1423 TaxID=1736462 RepID=UPI0006F6B740|nr:hypothetical protein [Brevundimonas sp. Root1423]KQY89513.1 hypothetical protein ASD25_02695 [Brevundimonas sp. Root1423]
MRRFFIWSALAAVIGLGIAIGGFWAYQHFYARFQPVTVQRNQSQIQDLLEQSSWISAGGGGEPLYIIGYRDSAAMQRYEMEEVPKLRAAGVEARIILFARPDREGLAQSTAAERASVAELWLTRDWTLYQRWTATPVRNWTAAGIPAADGNLARGAVVEAGRNFAANLAEKLNEEGLQTRYPLIIWRDREGFMKACACADPRSWTFIRDDLDAPDRIETPTVAPGDPAAPPVYPGDGSPESLPYPTLQAPADGSAPVPAPTPGTTPAPGTAPIAPRPATPPVPRKAPEPKQAEDTTFF